MITLHDHGVWYADGTLYHSTDEFQHQTGRDANPANDRKKTIAYRILDAHNQSNDPENLQIRFDSLTSHDIT